MDRLFAWLAIVSWAAAGLVGLPDVLAAMYSVRRDPPSTRDVIRTWLLGWPLCIIASILMGPIGWMSWKRKEHP